VSVVRDLYLDGRYQNIVKVIPKVISTREYDIVLSSQCGSAFR